MSPLTRALAVLMALAAASCSLSRLRADEAAKGEAGLLTGPVATPGRTGGNVTVALFRVGSGKPILEGLDRLTGLAGSFAFVVRAGERYVVVAFDDLDGDGKWEPGEPVAAVEGGRALAVGPRQVRIATDTVLRAGGGSGGYDLDLRAAGPGKSSEAPLALGEVASLDDPRFDPAHGEAGMWTSLAALQAGGFGLYFLEPYDPARIPVLFVHGIAGTPRDFKDVIGALDRTCFQAWVVHYASGFRLGLTAEALGRALQRLHGTLALDSLVITAHSMGGLVARGAILWLASQGEAGFVSTLVTFSTPWLGHDAAASGVKWLAVPVPAWVDMAPESEYLRSLRRPLPSGIAFHLLFGFGGGRSLAMGEANDGVITVASELASYAQEGAVRAWGFDLDHMAILSDPAPLARYAAILATIRSGRPAVR